MPMERAIQLKYKSLSTMQFKKSIKKKELSYLAIIQELDDENAPNDAKVSLKYK